MSQAVNLNKSVHHSIVEYHHNYLENTVEYDNVRNIMSRLIYNMKAYTHKNETREDVMGETVTTIMTSNVYLDGS